MRKQFALLLSLACLNDDLILAEVVDKRGSVRTSFVLGSQSEGIPVAHLAAGMYTIRLHDVYGVTLGRASVVVGR